jgi:hypothetical protein
MVAGVIAQLREDPIDRFTMFKRVVVFHNDEFGSGRIITPDGIA